MIFQLAKTTEGNISGSTRSGCCHATGGDIQGNAGGPGAPWMNTTPLSSLRLLGFGICEGRLWAFFLSSGLCKRPHGADVCGTSSSKSQVLGHWYTYTEDRAEMRLVRHFLHHWLPWMPCTCLSREDHDICQGHPSSPLTSSPGPFSRLWSPFSESLVTGLGTLSAFPLGF